MHHFENGTERGPCDSQHFHKKIAEQPPKQPFDQNKKIAADLAASHTIDFIDLFAPQLGLKPTTLRLTERSTT